MLRRGIDKRRSRTADWARVAGGLALPVLLLGIVGAQVGVVPEGALRPVLILAFALALGAAGLAIHALADIWNSGARGARSAVIGVVYATPTLVLLTAIAATATIFPRIADVSTDMTDPPAFTAEGAPRPPPDARTQTLQRKGYPLITTHVYAQSLGEVHQATMGIFEANGWRVVRDDRPSVMPMPDSDATSAMLVPEDDDLVRALAGKRIMSQSRSGQATINNVPVPAASPLPAPAAPTPQVVKADAPDPSAYGSMATLEGVARVPFIGLLDDVVVRLRMTPNGTEVDMRSASRNGPHDLGLNAWRIRRFYAALDATLQPEAAR